MPKVGVLGVGSALCLEIQDWSPPFPPGTQSRQDSLGIEDFIKLRQFF